MRALCPASRTLDLAGRPARTTWTVHGRFPEAHAEAWAALTGEARPFLSPAFLRALDAAPPESVGDGGSRLCLLATDAEGPAAAFHFQRVLLDGRQFGDFAPATTGQARIGWPQPVLDFGRSRLRAIRWPTAYAGTPLAPEEPGCAFHPRLDADARRRLLREAFRQVHAAWPGLRVDLASGPAAEQPGFHRLEAEPDFVLDLDPAWADFDGYLAALKSKYRVLARRTLRAADGLERRLLDATDIAADRDRWTTLYHAVTRRSDFLLARAGERHFEAMKAAFGDAYRFTAWYAPDGRAVGFHSALCTPAAGGTELEARFIGLDYAFAGPRRLYPAMLYAYVEEALRLGCRRVRFGRTASESKAILGARPEPGPIGFRYRHPLLGPVAGLLAREARPRAYVPRHPFRGSGPPGPDGG